MSRGLEQTFLQRRYITQMANKHMKQYSILLTIRAMKSRPQWNTTLHWLGLLAKKNKKKNRIYKCWWGNGKIGALVHWWWEHIMVQAPCKTVSDSPKFKHRCPMWPSNSGSRYMPKVFTAGTWAYVCTPTFVTASFPIARVWKQPHVHQQMNG